MSNDYFKFKLFTIRQERCAMKVGTDGTLLGAWANGGSRILDIGTGTGLIALMMAQRFATASITGVEIDPEAASQARQNVEASPFRGRVFVTEGDVNSFDSPAFDAVVANPPFFVNSLACPDNQRSRARHTLALTYAGLMKASRRLLSDNGELSVVIPFDCKARLEQEASLHGFFKSRECAVKTTPTKERPRRFLLAFRRHPCTPELSEGILESVPGQRSQWYNNLTHDFYL